MPQSPQTSLPWLGALAESRIYARIGLPILLTQLCTMANGVVDTLMSGHADRLQIGGFVKETGLDASLELAGVAIGNGIWASLMMTCLGLLFATTPMVAEHYGAGRMHYIGTVVRRLFWSALGLGLGLTAIGWLVSYLVEPWMKPDTGHVTAGYLRIVAVGAAPLALVTLLRCYCEGMTQTRPITVISLIGVAINIPLNAIFIYGLFGLDPMGGIGCGLATALVNWILFFITLGYVYWAPFYRPTELFRGWHLPIHRRTIDKQWRLGGPIAVTMLVELSMFPGMAVLIAVKQLPNAVIAGHQIAMTIAGVLYMFPLAVGLTSTVRLGNLIGGKHFASLSTASRFPLFTATAIAALNALVLLLFRNEIAELYSRAPEVIEIAAGLLLYALIFQFVDGWQGTALGVLRGLSKTFEPMVCIAVSYWLIGIPVAYVAAFVGLSVPGLELQPLGVAGLWLGMIFGLCAAAVTLVSYQLWFVPHKTRSLTARKPRRKIANSARARSTAAPG